ncbi:FGGY-family carbohydrate kinase [Phytohabitans houttuyneae]|uniref:Xylulokinase n=1 Tax=Phytohabitans houttuyneae TaxID=1076126 RepID=A0A6V8KAQ8_9ACTN|nr:FGGY-family carbohydrate kinase [Phytohabitans houttuyneae]GFJ80854.1 xylulokinase [Phytohabitans houttuyneae]
MTPLALVIDLGTSAVKVALVDGRGRVRARSRTPTLGPREWWHSVSAAVRALGDLSEVHVVAVTSFMHTLVPVLAGGGMGAVLLPGDKRGVAREPEFDAGSPGGSAALARLAAWAELGEGRLRAAVPVKDYLRYRLTGALASDPYDAGGAGLRSPAAAALLKRLGVEPVPLLAPDEVAGTVTPGAADRTGLSVGTPVVTGSGDWLAVCLGAQAAFPGRGVLYAGTSAAYGGFADRSALAAPREVDCLAVAVGSGALLDWAAGVFGPPSGAVADLLALAAAAPPGAHGVRFVPRALRAAGSREAVVGQGDLTGLSLAAERADAARAVVDGIAVWVGDRVGRILDASPVDQVLLCGGGGDATFAQLLSDALGRPLSVAAETDLGLIGLARLGFAGIGLPMDHDPGVEATLVEPDPVRHTAFAELRAELAGS